MRISTRPLFMHAGHLYLPPQRVDPRSTDFSEQEIDIDLRGCEFIAPEAALWCVVYANLAAARGAHVRLLVPESIGVCIHLKSSGLFRTLQEAGVEVDDRGIPNRPGPQAIVPITRFESQGQVDALSDAVLESLDNSNLGAANMHPLVSETFEELALNAVQHSESSVGAYGVIQFYESSEHGMRFVCAVADGGIGIRQSLERNPNLRSVVPYDWTAIELALQQLVSSTGSPTRGIGLPWVAQEVRQGKGSVLIHSGQGMLQINGQVDSPARRTRLFPGTLASATIPT